MSNARWLLSEAALPEIAVPSSSPRTERRFRLPTCIGKPADYKLRRRQEREAEGRIERVGDVSAAAPEAAASGRFAERTLNWFSLGEEQAEQERRDHAVMIRAARVRRVAGLVAAVVAGFAVVGVVLIAVVL